MNADAAITEIALHADELKALGVCSLSLFGSTARDEQGPDSDIDVAVKLDDGVRGLTAFRRLAEVKNRLTEILGTEVDVVREPTSPGAVKTAIERDRRVAF